MTHLPRPTTSALLLLLTTAVVSEAADASRTHKQIGVHAGLCVLVGENQAERALALATVSDLVIYVPTTTLDQATTIRKAADAAGLLGTRITVDHGDPQRIGLASNLADAVVIQGSTRTPVAELMRVLRPRGRLIINGKILVKPVPKGTGQWSHPYHGADNNPQSTDTLAKAPYLTKFLATPWYGPMPEVTVSAGGRMFKAFGFLAFKKREWPMVGKLVCLNGYNGATLWTRLLTPGFMIHRSTIVATTDTLYLADNTSCKLIDTATGTIRDEIVVPESHAAHGKTWKWMTLRNGILYALVGPTETLHQVHLGTRTKTGWPWATVRTTYDGSIKTWGFGRTLLAFDTSTKKVIWSHTTTAPIDGRAVAMNSNRIFLYSHQHHLEAINVEDGTTAWNTTDKQLLETIGAHHRAQTASLGYSTSAYLKCNNDALFFAGPTRTKLVAVSAKTGKLLWSYKDGNMQLILRDDGLYAMGRLSESKKFEPLTGKVLADLQCFRGNCTRATGTVDSIFTRGYRHTGTMRFDVSYQKPRRLPGMRPACQDGVIVANGQLYWGPWMCDCNHSLVGVISLTGAGDFEFEREAIETERLETFGNRSTPSPAMTSADWPTYRGNNQRTAATDVRVPTKLKLAWQTRPRETVEPTAPVTAAGLTLVAGSDGTVRAYNSADGTLRWTAHTGGSISYPPSIANGRVHVGSGDGRAWCFDLATGKTLWCFRAAPLERRIPVYGRLLSTWPVASGVMVDDDVAYCAAGIICHDGTHVYALDAATGKLRWQNNSSGNLLGKDESVGVSVQGHMLMHNGIVHLAGGNVVSPAKYDSKTGKCLNSLTPKPGTPPGKSLDENWKMQRSSRGSELFLVENQVAVAGDMLYAPPTPGPPSRYNAKFLLQANSGDVIIQGTDKALLRVDPKGGPDGQAKILWKDTGFARTQAVVLTPNAVIVAGELPAEQLDGPLRPALVARDPNDGKPLWAQALPAPPRKWGLAIDRDGRIVLTLIDGRTVCFAADN
jgi:outer membrane protein assembly factor BamB